MSRFRKREKRVVPILNTAALPDLIFTLLFFFMIVTQMRTIPILTQVDAPNATELQKLESQSRLIYLLVGEKQGEPGEYVIQLNSAFSSLGELPSELEKIKNEADPSETRPLTVVLKIDRNTPMGLVNDIRQILRETGLLTIYYSAEKERKK